ncbi:MAG: DNA repair protein RadC [Clostridia bacterium]|nr:DNA repair protein RadC [Clostridia bacterium]
MESRTMKTLPEGLRPYERLEAYGPETLSDTELIAILLKSGNRNRNAVEVAQDVLTRSEGLYGLGELSVKALTEISGVGAVKAITLLAAFELGRRISKGEQGKKTKISSIEQLASLYAPVMHLPQEHFKVVLLDRKWQILKDVTVSVGTVDKAIVHPREVFSPAVVNRASGVVVMHNHPSGDCTPSQADRDTTRRLSAAGNILGIVLADHIIYGRDRYYSFFLEGDLEELRSE